MYTHDNGNQAQEMAIVLQLTLPKSNTSRQNILMHYMKKRCLQWYVNTYALLLNTVSTSKYNLNNVGGAILNSPSIKTD